MDKIESIEWDSSDNVTWLHINIKTEAHTNMVVGLGIRHQISIYYPTEDDLLCIIKGASDGLMKLREYNATKGE